MDTINPPHGKLLKTLQTKAFIKNSLMCSTFYSGNVLCEQIWLPSCGHGVCLVYALFPRLSFGSNQLHSPNYPYEYNGNNCECIGVGATAPAN